MLLAFSSGNRLFAQSDSLAHYLRLAAKNNPGLKADYLAYQAALQRIPQAGAIPDPQMEMGFFLKPMDIIDGKQVADFTLMQMFPWFETRKAAQTEAGYMANVAFENFRMSRDNLFLSIYNQWFVLNSLNQKEKNILEHREYLQQLEELSLRRYASAGSASGEMSEVLRIRLEAAELENSLKSVQSEINAEKAKFNALLNRPSKSEVSLPYSFEKILFNSDISSANAEILQENPELGMIQEESLSYQAKAETDRKMSMPMLGVGLQYSLIKKRAGDIIPVTQMNGMDMLMPMVSVSIPIYRNKYKAQQKESELLQQAAGEKFADTQNALQAELAEINHGMEDALRKIDLTEKQTELALTAYNLLLREFSTGKSSLTDLIQVQRQLLDYRLEKSDAVAGYNKLVASAQRILSFNINEQ